MPDRQPQVGQQGFDEATQRDVWWDGRGWSYEPTPPALPQLEAMQPGAIPDPGQSSAHAGGRTAWSAGGAMANLAQNVPEAIGNTVAGGARMLGYLNPMAVSANASAAAQYAPAVVRGLWNMAKGAASDPAGAAIDVADAVYRRPVETAAMLAPGAQWAGLPRVARALDVPAATIRGLGNATRWSGNKWMAGVAKVPSSLKNENRGIDIAATMADEGILPLKRGGERASRLIKREQGTVDDIVRRTPHLIERKGPAGAITQPPGPSPTALINDAPAPATPVRTREGPIAPGTEELREAMSGIDPLADTNNVMRNALGNELDWYESQWPEPMSSERLNTVKGQLQDQVSYGVRQKELANQTLAKKKLAVGARRVQSEVQPEIAPHNQRIGRLVAAEEAAVEAGKRTENYNRFPARAMWGGSMGGTAALAGVDPAIAAALAVSPFLIDHPLFGGMGAIGMNRVGRGLQTIGQIPSAPAITEEAMRRALGLE